MCFCVCISAVRKPIFIGMCTALICVFVNYVHLCLCLSTILNTSHPIRIVMLSEPASVISIRHTMFSPPKHVGPNLWCIRPYKRIDSHSRDGEEMGTIPPPHYHWLGVCVCGWRAGLRQQMSGARDDRSGSHMPSLALSLFFSFDIHFSFT